MTEWLDNIDKENRARTIRARNRVRPGDAVTVDGKIRFVRKVARYCDRAMVEIGSTLSPWLSFSLLGLDNASEPKKEAE